jgi:lipopolysaccharide/colanic/teichoic acid biosynthesis glycosyltransferase
LKRAFDIVASAMALLLGWPLLLAIAVLVWVDSGRPILFSQERVGRGFRRFRIWKFRSMRPANRGPAITVAGDRRVTRAGAFLRAAKLDELPQFWNVLAGDMSLVGPRPEVPAYVELYRSQYARILQVRPGVTDPGSVAYRHEEELLASVPEPERFYREVVLPKKLQLAAQYLDRQSFALDLRILFRTLAVMLNLGSAKC